MNTKYPALAAAIAAMLIGATALATDSVFAYDKSQATAQSNGCGNGELPLNIACQNSASQIQGDENSAALASEQAFGVEEDSQAPE